MTNLILKIEGIDEAETVEFYIERDKSKEAEVIKRYIGQRAECYVKIPDFGRGHLMCRVVFKEEDRNVVVSGFTGFTIPCMGEGKTISCGGRVVSFERVDNIPDENTFIYFGVTTDLEKIDLERLEVWDGRNDMIVSFSEGDIIVVIIPTETKVGAFKDNGFNDKVPFSTKILGVNGKEQTIESRSYKIFGELMTIGGMIKLYIV